MSLSVPPSTADTPAEILGRTWLPDPDCAGHFCLTRFFVGQLHSLSFMFVRSLSRVPFVLVARSIPLLFRSRLRRLSIPVAIAVHFLSVLLSLFVPFARACHSFHRSSAPSFVLSLAAGALDLHCQLFDAMIVCPGCRLHPYRALARCFSAKRPAARSDRLLILYTDCHHP